jgi:hypothetical protein
MRCYLHDRDLASCPECKFTQAEDGVWHDKDGLTLAQQFLRHAPYPIGGRA